MKYSPDINNKSSRYKMLPPFRWLKLWYSCTVSTTSTTASPPTPWWWWATPWPSWACWTGWWARRRRWRRGRRPLSICQAGGVDTVPNPGSTVTCSVSAVFCWNSPQVRGLLMEITGLRRLRYSELAIKSALSSGWNHINQLAILILWYNDIHNHRHYATP